MTHNLDPNNESPFGLIYPEDAPFGPPIRLEPHEVSSGEVPPYERRVEILMGDAHRILLAFETWREAEAPMDQKIEQQGIHVRRWLDRYELHLCQIDHPDLRVTPETIDGEVKDERGAV